MNKKTWWFYGLGLVTVPVLVLAAVLGFNGYEILTTPKQAPMAATAPNLVAGAQVYADNCAACHGLPDQTSRPHAAAGFWPGPPQFFQRFRGRGPAPSPAQMNRFAQRRTLGSYVTVRDGVPGTGMPAFAHTLSSNQLWQVSLMMGRMQELPAAEAVLHPVPSPATPASPESATPASLPSAGPAPGAAH